YAFTSALPPTNHLRWRCSGHLFFFSPSGAPPSLPSFPTRRSSDLCLIDPDGLHEIDRMCAAYPETLVVIDHLRIRRAHAVDFVRSEEHTAELHSVAYLVCRRLPEKNTGADEAHRARSHIRDLERLR